MAPLQAGEEVASVLRVLKGNLGAVRKGRTLYLKVHLGHDRQRRHSQIDRMTHCRDWRRDWGRHVLRLDSEAGNGRAQG